MVCLKTSMLKLKPHLATYLASYSQYAIARFYSTTIKALLSKSSTIKKNLHAQVPLPVLLRLGSQLKEKLYIHAVNAALTAQVSRLRIHRQTDRQANKPTECYNPWPPTHFELIMSDSNCASTSHHDKR